jgi:hypothetical protein
MIGPNTNRSVALMEHPQPIGDRPVVKLPRNAVSKDRRSLTTASPHHPVATRSIGGSSEIPATAQFLSDYRPAFIDLFPQAICDWPKTATAPFCGTRERTESNPAGLWLKERATPFTGNHGQLVWRSEMLHRARSGAKTARFPIVAWGQWSTALRAETQGISRLRMHVEPLIRCAVPPVVTATRGLLTTPLYRIIDVL